MAPVSTPIGAAHAATNAATPVRSRSHTAHTTIGTAVTHNKEMINANLVPVRIVISTTPQGTLRGFPQPG